MGNMVHIAVVVVAAVAAVAVAAPRKPRADFVRKAQKKRNGRLSPCSL